MKNFYELLATDLRIALHMLITAHTDTVHVVINDQPQAAQQTANGLEVSLQLPLLQPIDICVYRQTADIGSLTLDGWQVRPHWGTEYSNMWQFTTNGQPFYRWKHQATGQGWLLSP